MAESDDWKERHKFVSTALGADLAFQERFAIYLPNMGFRQPDGSQRIISDWGTVWIPEALDLLGDINGGATAMAIAEGYWIDEDHRNAKVWERTCVVYAFLRREKFKSSIHRVREFAHRFGRETGQGAVFFEYDDFAYSIPAPFDML